MKSFKTFKILFFSMIFIVCMFLFFDFSENGSSAKDEDAIAIRVIPNPNHYSARTWYSKQEFTGSPQSIIVDGYEGVREGRTVYVNAANINDKGTANPSDDEFFTNIYLISYNQKAETVTVDVFGQIISHWKFNTNLTEVDVCNESSDILCLLDSDCPKDEYCLSRKAKVVRDTKRMGDLSDIHERIAKYHETTGKYPNLPAGTYIPGDSLSVWSSWEKTLSQVLGAILPSDPVNKLGDCGASNFDPITCWDEQNKKFADPIPLNSKLDLPADSKSYLYEAESDGSSYVLCAFMESGMIGASGGMCNSLMLTNSRPEFVNVYLPVTEVKHPFEGYIEINDPDGDKIIWESIPLVLPVWAGWKSPLILEPTAEKNHIRVYNSQGSSAYGDFSFGLKLDDQKGGVVSRTFTIHIIAPPPTVSFKNLIYEASSTNPLYFNMKVSDEPSNFPITYIINSGTIPVGLTDPPLFAVGGINFYNFTISGIISTVVNIPTTINYNYNTTFTNALKGYVDVDFTITVVNNPPVIIPVNSVSVTVGKNDLNINPLLIMASDPQNNHINYSLSTLLPPGLIAVKVNDHLYKISGVPNGITPINTNYPNTVRAIDEYGAQSTADFMVTIRNQKPVMKDIFCLDKVRSGNPYTCTVSATDPDGHAIVNYDFWAGTFPPGFTISSSGVISGPSTVPGVYSGSVVAKDEYGAVSDGKVFTVTILSYCGDGVKQSPNMEGTGGPLNNGYEQCDDGNSLLTDTCNNSCVLTTCGDGIIQKINGFGVFEVCDDGNKVNTDTCLNNCQIAVCGDGVVRIGVEECDDGNLSNFDGCSSICQKEVCGNGTIQAGETCDDGNLMSGDGCDSFCQKEVCGNGILQIGEQCDDGNLINGDGCSSLCKKEVCGDGIIQVGEQCDGSNLGGKTCVDLSFSGGTLSCASNCTFNTSACTATVVNVPLNISGDCVWAFCPVTAPYPVACNVIFSGGDNRGCVAYVPGDTKIFLKEGNACGAGSVSGSLTCSNVAGVINASTCPINKTVQYYYDDWTKCPT